MGHSARRKHVQTSGISAEKGGAESSCSAQRHIHNFDDGRVVIQVYQKLFKQVIIDHSLNVQRSQQASERNQLLELPRDSFSKRPSDVGDVPDRKNPMRC